LSEPTHGDKIFARFLFIRIIAMKIKNRLLKVSFLGLASVLMLTACSNFTPESPKDVVQKFKETLRDVKAADLQVDGVMSSADTKDNMRLNITLGAKFDHRDGVDRKGDLGLKLGGNLVAGGKNLDGSVDLDIRTIGDAFYFNIAKLDSSDPEMAKYKEVIDGYRGKWLHLASDFVPESLKQFQKKDEKALAREKQLKDLFVNTNLFEVNKEFGVESLSGKQVYHYGIKVSEDGFKEYTRKAAQVDGREMSDAEVEQAATFVKSIGNIELWIGTKDYYLYKGVATLSGQADEAGVKSDLSINYVGNSYNADPKIVSPQNPEEFNPITLMMQLQMLNPTPATPEAQPEVKADEAAPAPAAAPAAKAPAAKAAPAKKK
jgi:hypothetical protein